MATLELAPPRADPSVTTREANGGRGTTVLPAPVRLALVIGNGAYTNAPQLRNPERDARGVATRLEQLGYRVRTEIDVTTDRFTKIIAQFSSELEQIVAAGASVAAAVVFYAGHGVQVRGVNYLLPVDGQFSSEAELRLRSVNLDVVLQAMSANAATSVVLLDCCRNNPLPRMMADGGARALAGHQGLAGLDVPNGAFVAYATQPDAVADDGEGEHSPFSQALLKYMAQEDTPISDLMIYVRRDVHQATDGRQIPWDRSALFQPFAFQLSRPDAPLVTLTAQEVAAAKREAEVAREVEYWALIRGSGSVELLRSFVVQFPHSDHRPEAQALIDDLRFRRWWRQLSVGTAAIVLGAVALVAAWIGVEYSRFTNLLLTDDGRAILRDGAGRPITLDNADIVGNDIDLPIVPTTNVSMAWYRIGCIFDSRCTAISYEPIWTDATGARHGGVCYRKLASGYFIRPNAARADDPSNSEYVRRRGFDKVAAAPKPLPADWTLIWDRTLIGVPVAKDTVLGDPRFLDPNGRNPYRDDRRTGKYYFRVGNADCHERCAALGDGCKGYSFTPLGFRCQLFQSVIGLARDREGNEVHTPATQSACRDPSVPDCASHQ